MRFIILTVGKLRRIEPISSPGYRTGGAAGSALIRSATWRLNKRKPVSTGSVVDYMKFGDAANLLI